MVIRVHCPFVSPGGLCRSVTSENTILALLLVPVPPVSKSLRLTAVEVEIWVVRSRLETPACSMRVLYEQYVAFTTPTACWYEQGRMSVHSRSPISSEKLPLRSLSQGLGYFSYSNSAIDTLSKIASSCNRNQLSQHLGHSPPHLQPTSVIHHLPFIHGSSNLLYVPRTLQETHSQTQSPSSFRRVQDWSCLISRMFRWFHPFHLVHLHSLWPPFSLPWPA